MIFHGKARLFTFNLPRLQVVVRMMTPTPGKRCFTLRVYERLDGCCRFSIFHQGQPPTVRSLLPKNGGCRRLLRFDYHTHSHTHFDTLVQVDRAGNDRKARSANPSFPTGNQPPKKRGSVRRTVIVPFPWTRCQFICCPELETHTHTHNFLDSSHDLFIVSHRFLVRSHNLLVSSD